MFTLVERFVGDLKLQTIRSSKSFNASLGWDASSIEFGDKEDKPKAQKEVFWAKARALFKKGNANERVKSRNAPIVMRHRDSMELAMREHKNLPRKSGQIMNHRNSLDLAMRPPEECRRFQRSPAA